MPCLSDPVSPGFSPKQTNNPQKEDAVCVCVWGIIALFFRPEALGHYCLGAGRRVGWTRVTLQRQMKEKLKPRGAG
jgi:hypothetical protein